MAGETPNTVESDLASAPAPDTALTAREGDDAIAALFRNPETDPVENAEGENQAAEETEEPVAEEEGPDTDELSLSEDVDKTDDEEPDASKEYAEGRFAADDAKVKLEDGTTISVADLKRNSLFHRDYTVKTMELSEQRKALETQQTEFSQTREQIAKEREFIAEFAKAYVPTEPKRPELPADVDPVGWAKYAEAKYAYDDMLSWWNVAKEQGTKAQQEQAEQAKRDTQQRIAAESAKLRESFPVLKDATKAKPFWDRLSSKAQEHYGISDDEVKGIMDHRMIRILNDAIAAKERQIKTPKTQEIVGKKPPLIQGSGKRQNPDALAMRESANRVSRLRETGSNRDAEAVILSFLK